MAFLGTMFLFLTLKTLGSFLYAQEICLLWTMAWGCVVWKTKFPRERMRSVVLTSKKEEQICLLCFYFFANQKTIALLAFFKNRKVVASTCKLKLMNQFLTFDSFIDPKQKKKGHIFPG